MYHKLRSSQAPGHSLTRGHDGELAGLRLPPDDVLACAVEGAVVLAAARRRRELQGGDEAVGAEAVVVERHLAAGAAATLFDAVVEVPRVRHHGRVGVNL